MSDDDDLRAERLAAHDRTKAAAREPMTAAEARQWFAELAAVAEDSRQRR
ncbi:hypothetical protein [Flexivirga sp. B27]